MSLTRQARVSAFAKINLDLRVLGLRPDGYHEIRTVLHTISLADRLEIAFSPARATSIEVSGNADIPPEENLAVKAARLVLEALGKPARVALRLEKRIPMGAGLGGGSSDAAAVLLALPVLAGAAIETAELIRLGALLGSDVPFFLLGGAATAIGRGTELYPLPDLPARKGLLVTPDVHVSTASAYRALSSCLTAEAQQNKIFTFQSKSWNGNWDNPSNDFEPVLFEKHPELARLKRRLLRLGARPALVTGSGAALYGLFDAPASVARARDSLSGENVFPFALISRARFRSAWRRGLAAHAANNHIWPLQSRYA